MDLGKSLINRFVAPSEFKPASGNPSYPWVEAIARLMRPAIGLIVLATWATMHLQGIATQEVDNFASAVGFYLFGERSLFYIKKK